MKIKEISIDKDITKHVGLHPVSMKKIGSMVLLAGKNGSGKPRILDLIRKSVANIPEILSQKENVEEVGGDRSFRGVVQSNTLIGV